MKKITLLLFGILLTNCGSVNTANEPILVGKIKKQDLQQPIHATWYTPGFETYQPSNEIIAQIKSKAKGINITIYMGTWCGDSQLQVPNFYKVLSKAGIPDSKVSLICVDRNKTTPQGTEKALNITNVPTFIFYKNNIELNRIVESPRVSLEDDMLQILSGKAYKHIYAQ